MVPASGKVSTLVRKCLDSIFLKKPSSSLLIVLSDDSESSQDVLLHIKTQTYGPEKLTVYATSEALLQLLNTALEGYASGTIITTEVLPENQLLPSPVPHGYDVVIGLRVAERTATKLAGIPPLAILTHDGEVDQSSFEFLEKYFAHRATDDATSVLIVADPCVLSTDLPDSVIFLVPSSPSPLLTNFATVLQAKIEDFGVIVYHARPTQKGISNLAGQSVISLLEIDSASVYAWTENEFLAFKTLVSTVRHLFWITRGILMNSWSTGVEFASSQGLFRVMRNEHPMAILPTLDLSSNADLLSERFADLVVNIWRASLGEDADMEYVELNSVIHVPRATGEEGLDHELQLANNSAPPIWTAMGASTNPRRASELAHTKGHVWTEETAFRPLEDGEVEVQVEFVGLEASHHTLSSVKHAVGNFIRTGNDCAEFFSGQQVVVFINNVARTHVRQSKTVLAPLPEGLRPEEAITFIEPLIAAQYALIEVARLSQGQTVLLDNAASAVGQALIQVAKASGDEVFALVDSKAERDLIVDRLAHAPAPCAAWSHLYSCEVQTSRLVTGRRGSDTLSLGM